MKLPTDLVLSELPDTIVKGTGKDSISFLQKKAQSNIVLFDAKDCDARTMIEKVKPQIVFNAEFHKKGDHGHQVNSGLDLPTFKFLKEYNGCYAIDCTNFFKTITSSKTQYILSRFKQNVYLAKKTKVPIFVFSGSKKMSLEKRNSVLSILQ